MKTEITRERVQEIWCLAQSMNPHFRTMSLEIHEVIALAESALEQPAELARPIQGAEGEECEVCGGKKKVIEALSDGKHGRRIDCPECTTPPEGELMGEEAMIPYQENL